MGPAVAGSEYFSQSSELKSRGTTFRYLRHGLMPIPGGMEKYTWITDYKTLAHK